MVSFKLLNFTTIKIFVTDKWTRGQESEQKITVKQTSCSLLRLENKRCFKFLKQPEIGGLRCQWEVNLRCYATFPSKAFANSYSSQEKSKDLGINFY